MSELPKGQADLDLDQSLEKIIKETPLEDLERDEIINILKVKLNDKNSSTKDDQLTLSETLSFIKETCFRGIRFQKRKEPNSKKIQLLIGTPF